jgi:hypothetical protein
MENAIFHWEIRLKKKLERERKVTKAERMNGGGKNGDMKINRKNKSQKTR